MIIIRNNIIPFSGFKALNFLGLILFVRKSATLTDEDMNHEKIHSAQYFETLFIGFFIIYLFSWIYNIFRYDNPYRAIVFERECYMNQDNMYYLRNRKLWSWINYF